MLPDSGSLSHCSIKTYVTQLIRFIIIAIVIIIVITGSIAVIARSSKRRY